jgi:site-specific recombinase
MRGRSSPQTNGRKGFSSQVAIRGRKATELDETELRRMLRGARDALDEHRRNRPAHSVPMEYELKLERLEEEVDRLQAQLRDLVR